MAVTKLDVLDDLDEIKICIGYRYRGKRYNEMPSELKVLEGCEPVYESMAGWKASTAGLSEYGTLPQKAQRYLARIEELIGVEIGIISTGFRRDETIILKKIF